MIEFDFDLSRLPLKRLLLKWFQKWYRPINSLTIIFWNTHLGGRYIRRCLHNYIIWINQLGRWNYTNGYFLWYAGLAQGTHARLKVLPRRNTISHLRPFFGTILQCLRVIFQTWGFELKETIHYSMICYGFWINNMKQHLIIAKNVKKGSWCPTSPTKHII